MKRTRHSAEQFMSELREAKATLAASRTVAQLVQALGVGEQTFNRWRNRCRGMKEGATR